jgi:hypothetical protein
MTGTMSFLNAPDQRTLGRVAGALAVDEAFVEKDWFVVQAIRTLMTLGGELFTPIFSGGTSLLKGHQLIKRFSEDIDFKLKVSPAFLALAPSQRKRALSNFKKELATAWEATGYTILKVEAGSGNAFIKIEMDYPSVLIGHASLRPHILAELSAKPPRRAPLKRSLSSFVNQFHGGDPEVPEILCVDPVETAADKLSAFTWRVLVRERGSEKDDPTIIRHMHDLAALENIVAADEAFGTLLIETLDADSGRGNGVVAHLAPMERLAAMLEKLGGDPLYRDDYDIFVGGLAFAGVEEVPDFATATEALRRLTTMLAA